MGFRNGKFYPHEGVYEGRPMYKLETGKIISIYLAETVIALDEEDAKKQIIKLAERKYRTGLVSKEGHWEVEDLQIIGRAG